MPRRAVSLLDDTIEPTQKKIVKTEKRYTAVFLVSCIQEPGVWKEREETIEAPNRIAAINKARTMCHNPVIFPAGQVARIPDANVTENEYQRTLRRYEALFEIFRDGNVRTRPRTVRKVIDAENRKAAYGHAQQICDEMQKEYDSWGTVRCPLKNIRIFKY